jgi:hypothetical protein
MKKGFLFIFLLIAALIVLSKSHAQNVERWPMEQTHHGTRLLLGQMHFL